MKIIFDYDIKQDIWCLLAKGKSSNNSNKPTKVYERLVEEYGEKPTENDTASFIENYIRDKDIVVEDSIGRYKKEWLSISNDFQKRAESIFGVSLPYDITAYLTVNVRLPYSISENNFFVYINSDTIRQVAMHELWHFYTWYGLGPEQEKILGKQQYNDSKEALSVLLNVECKDLMPEGVIDRGYPQHQEVREKILDLWSKDKNIKKLWETINYEYAQTA